MSIEFDSIKNEKNIRERDLSFEQVREFDFETAFFKIDDRFDYATPKERSEWRLLGSGLGIHWQDVDEDISLENLLFGQPSGESQKSLQKWLDNRV